MPPRADRIVRRPIVGVMGSSLEPHTERAREVGRWIAAQGYHLLTGGGPGVMGAVTEAFVGTTGRLGAALAVVPCIPGVQDATPLPGYPNPWVEIPIYTHLDTGGDAADPARRARRGWRCATAVRAWRICGRARRSRSCRTAFQSSRTSNGSPHSSGAASVRWGAAPS